MSATITVKPEREATVILPLIQSAVNAEIARLELALQLAEDRLQPFERKYHISSTEFMESWTAEDLEDGDDEYIVWAGEYQLKQRLFTKLTPLRTLSYHQPPLVFTEHKHLPDRVEAAPAPTLDDVFREILATWQ